MEKKYSLSLHIFRRDLRLPDNTALIAALENSDKVIPCFIFDKRQVEQNSYKSENCIEFMIHSLQELNTELHKKNAKLYYFYGIAEDIVAECIQKLNINAVFMNRDYTPFSIHRDRKIANLCKKHHLDFHYYSDALLHEPEEVYKSDHEPYTIFTPFLRKSLEIAVDYPHKNTKNNYYQNPIEFEDKHILEKLSQHKNPNLFVKGGRHEALVLLKEIRNLKKYADLRNFPALNGTTKLSAHNKFGTISIREFYHHVVTELGKHHSLITELYWRDFFTHVTFYFPRVFGAPFHEKYRELAWSQNHSHFRAWCEGRTGFPIVDAGMRELNITGYMHNRVRMIVASFLTKDLHIDWRLGEQYFAQKLIDYDPAVNNGNWQWAASTGCDAQPYFRIFNPWLQQKKFDADCLYIKRWIPELATLDPKVIHQWNTKGASFQFTNYPLPIVEHRVESEKAKRDYRGVSTFL